MKNSLEKYLIPEIYDAEYGRIEEDLGTFLSLKTMGLINPHLK
ncbi:hypothetical protein NF27_BK00370 [Candidatus Jidaibacter acanthamoeba]|uniref:Uncharacterized protein n=1 Tax=Candidatus Jidaibacter acanthamoebae TaxID=86105 RepID=A0A0C1N164_9RICK|nr:hypothetical protein [Candidatus Jidaibacter acanthamoeba]KIE06116.1 hypothetical protein NF27_BK00370 [Candidatus Jidaibacter acanthamoeba]